MALVHLLKNLFSIISDYLLTFISRSVLKKNGGSENEADIPAVCLRSVLKAYNGIQLSRAQYTSYVGAINSYIGKIYSGCFTVADRIYARYRLEKLFNFELIDCLWQNMEATSKRTGIDLFWRGDMDCYASCVCLPNVFTRKYIMQFAFDSLMDTGLSTGDDFWSPLANSASFGQYALKDDPSLAFPLWNQRVRKSIDFLSKFVFPVYRSCFFVYLFQALQTNIANKESSANKKNSVGIVNLYNALSGYLNQADYEKNIGELSCFNNCNVIQSNYSIEKDESDLSHYKICMNIVKVKEYTDTPGLISFSNLKTLDKRTQGNPFLNYYMLCASGYAPTKIV